MDEEMIIEMMDDTSRLVAKRKQRLLSSSAVAAQSSNSLTNNVEFWQWMGRNYKNSGIFNTNGSMLEYMSQTPGKEEWILKQLQGKGYEWDWMSQQRGQLSNIFKKYDAGDVANRAASDVTEFNLLNGATKEYQMKAYTGKTNPHLNNTPKDMTVVTNVEKAEIVKKNGYKNVEEFQNNKLIKEATQKRKNQIESGKAYTRYGVKNVAGTMTKAGVIGFSIGVGLESLSLYKSWKEGKLSDEDYLNSILKAGGDMGVTAGLTAGIMIPISATIATAGITTVVTFPIAFFVGSAVNKVVAPCFGRGEYQKILSKAKYYQTVEAAYVDFIMTVEDSAYEYQEFISKVIEQNRKYKQLKEKDKIVTNNLKDIYDSI